MSGFYRFYKRHKYAIIILLSFALPALLLVLSFAASGIYPFGDKTLMFHDAFYQYLPFWTYYKDMLAGRQELTYALEKTLGGSMINLYAYYLASPFNLIFLLFPVEKFSAAMMVIVVLKLSLAGMNFSLFARKNGGSTPYTVLFASAYALCGYSVGYMFNIMWLDGVMILPLVALGIRKIVDGGTPWLYIASLAYSIITSYYIGFMLCVFSVIYFAASALMRYSSVKELGVRKLASYIFGSVAAGALSAFIIVPSYLSLSQGKDVSDPRTVRIALTAAAVLIPASYAVLLLVRKRLIPVRAAYTAAAAVMILSIAFTAYRDVTAGSYTLLKLLDCTGNAREIRVGSAQLCMGMFALTAACLYFVNGSVPKRERLIRLALCCVMLLSMSFTVLNRIWHGFASNEGFNYRYSFIFSFILSATAQRSASTAGRLSLRACIAGTGAVTALCAAGVILAPGFVSVPWACAGIVLSVLYCAALRLRAADKIPSADGMPSFDGFHKIKGKRRRLLSAALLILLAVANIFEIYSSALFTVTQNRDTYQVPVSEFSEKYENARDKTGLVRENDGELYRVKFDSSFFGNNCPMLLDYNGAAHFSSTENTDSVRFLSSAGCTGLRYVWANAECGSSRGLDSLLGVKYYIDFDEPDGCTAAAGDSTYRNPDALPLAFISDTGITASSSINEHGYDPFGYLNELYRLICPEADADLYYGAETVSFETNGLDPLDPSALPVSGSDAVPGSRCAYAVTDGGGSVSMRYILNITSDDPLYFYITGGNFSDIKIFVNGEEADKYDDHGYYWRTVCLGSFEPSSQAEIVLEINCGVPELYMGDILFHYESRDVLRRYHDMITSQRCVTGSERDDRFVSDVSVSGNGSCVLYTVPYEKGWRAEIDGKPAAAVKAAGIFLAVPVPPGEHTVSVSYVVPGLKAGIVISLSALCLILLCAAVSRYKQKSGLYRS